MWDVDLDNDQDAEGWTERRIHLVRLAPVIAHEAVGAMRAHPGSGGVQEECCRVLLSLAAEHEHVAEQLLSDTDAAAGGRGVPTLIVAALASQGRRNGTLVYTGSRALTDLAGSSNAERARRVADEAAAAGAVKALRRAIRAHGSGARGCHNIRVRAARGDREAHERRGGGGGGGSCHCALRSG